MGVGRPCSGNFCPCRTIRHYRGTHHPQLFTFTRIPIVECRWVVVQITEFIHNLLKSLTHIHMFPLSIISVLATLGIKCNLPHVHMSKRNPRASIFYPKPHTPCTTGRGMFVHLKAVMAYFDKYAVVG